MKGASGRIPQGTPKKACYFNKDSKLYFDFIGDYKMKHTKSTAQGFYDDFNVPVVFAYKIYTPDRFQHIKIGCTESNPQLLYLKNPSGHP